jgi:hypothetical protein
MKSLFLLFALLVVSTGCRAQVPDAPRDTDVPLTEEATARAVPEPDPETRRLFDEVMADPEIDALRQRPIGDVMQAFGMRFIGKPYVAGMLDEPEEEQLICSLYGFDCVTFVESTLALARAVKAGDRSYEAFATNIRETRYRGGEMDGYCSRLHYFTEWISDNERRGIVEDVTRDVGGVRLEKTINFMTEHRQSYPRFASNDSLFTCVREVEERLARQDYYYVPQERIRAAYGGLRAGDIVALVTNIKGLDVVHTGLVYDAGDAGKGLLHASTSGGVMVSPDLQEYVQNIRTQIGIVVARPVK